MKRKFYSFLPLIVICCYHVVLKLCGHLKNRKKTVVVSLWNELATGVGQELLDTVDKSPIVAIKSLKAGDFQGNLMLKCYMVL